MSDLNHQPSVELSSYSQDVPSVISGDTIVNLANPVYGQSAINSGSFIVGLYLETYANADKAAIFS